MHGQTSRSSHPEVFLGKCILKTYSKLTKEHPCRSAMLINLQCNFIEITLWHGCSPVNLLRIFRIPFLKNTSGRLLLKIHEFLYLKDTKYQSYTNADLKICKFLCLFMKIICQSFTLKHLFLF